MLNRNTRLLSETHATKPKMTKDTYYQLLTRKTAGAMQRSDSQLANFHRKTARILRVTDPKKSSSIPALYEEENDFQTSDSGFNLNPKEAYENSPVVGALGVIGRIPSDCYEQLPSNFQ
jgi:hypothetical protein